MAHAKGNATGGTTGNTMRYWATLATIGALLGIGLVLHPGQGATLPPCATEDETGCYWDAQTMGNGRGHDVVTLEGK